MKSGKILLRLALIVLVSFVSSFSAVAQIVNIPDPSIEEDLLKLKGLDANKNGEISVKEASSYEGDISVYFNTGYPDTDWLQYFPNIANLEVGTVMENLDLRFLKKVKNIDVRSGTTSLTKINLNGVSTLTSILLYSLNSLETIDLRNCTALEKINGVDYTGTTDYNLDFLFEKNNSLESIQFIQMGIGTMDLTQCPNLKSLSITACSISTLDVSGNSYLERLYLQNSPFMSLDISNNTLLNDFTFTISENLISKDEYFSCITVKDIADAEASLSADLPSGVVFSKNCNLDIPDESFMRYLLNNPKTNPDKNSTVTIEEAQAFSGTMSFGQAYVVTDFRGIEYFPGVTSITISNTALNNSSIDFSGLPNLTSIELSKSDCKALNISNCQKLTNVTISLGSIQSINYSGSTNITDLSIYDLNATKFNISSLTNLINFNLYNSTLTTLTTGNTNSLTKFNASGEFTSLDLSGYPKLQTLSLTSTDLRCITVLDPASARTKWASSVPEGARFSSDCDAALVQFPTTAIKNAVIAHSDIDGDGDGEVSKPEAQDYSGTLDLSSVSISSYDWLTDFSKITGLTISGGINISIKNTFPSLTSLTLSGGGSGTLDLSNTTTLQSLTLIGTSFSSINVSGCWNISSMNLGIASQLSSVIFNSNTTLGSFTVSSSNISSIDFTACPNLNTINLSGSPLTSLNLGSTPSNGYLTANNLTLPANSGLYCITATNPAEAESKFASKYPNVSFTADCDETVYLSNQFKTSLLANTALNINGDSEIQVWEANEYTGSLTIPVSVDLSSLSAFANITGLELSNAASADISIFPNLQTLSVSNSSIQTLDITKNTALTSVSITGTDNLSSFIASSLNSNLAAFIYEGTENSQLKDLDLNSIPLVTVNVTALNLASLNLNDVNLDDLTTLQVESPKLICVTVNNPEFAQSKFTNVGSDIVFSENCGALPTVTIPDENFKRFLCEIQGYDINGDSKIQVIEAEKVTAINLDGEQLSDQFSGQVTSIEGIEGFVNLQQLSWSHTPTGLTSIAINSNDNATYGDPILPNLTSITFDTHSFTDIDLTACTSVSNITITNGTSDETNCNIEGCTALTTLNVDYTHIPTLDISTLGALTTVDADQAYITEIILNNTNSSLQTLNVSGNQLTSLDLSYQPNIQTLDVSNNPELYCVQILEEGINVNWETKQDEYLVYSTDCSVEATYPLSSELSSFISIDNPSVDENEDGRITYKEVSEYAGLLRIPDNIDLTEIQDFVSITGLDLYNIEATEIDVTAFTNLQTLNISNSTVETLIASNLTNLIAIELTETDSLTALNVDGSTAISTFVFEGGENAKLSELNLSNTALTSANITAPELLSLNIENVNLDNLSELTIANSPKLICITTTTPEVATAKFTDLTSEMVFSGNCTTLEFLMLDEAFKADLISLGVDKNTDGEIQIAEANMFTGDITLDNPTIASLQGIDRFTNVANISITNGGEQLTSIDASKMTNLVSFNVTAATITDVALDGCTSLTDLTLTNAGTRQLNIEGNTSIENIAMEGNPLERLNVVPLENLQNLTVLSDSTTCIQVTDIDAAETAWGGTVGENIPFSTDCSEEDSIYIADPELKAILLANENLNTYHPHIISKSEAALYMDSIVVVSEEVDDLTGLETLVEISGLRLEGVKATALDASIYQSLESLQISNASFETIDAGNISTITSIVLNGLPNLTSLDVEGSTDLDSLLLLNCDTLSGINFSTNDALKTFAFTSEKNSVLTSLNLSNKENLTSVEVSAPSLQSLDFRGTPILNENFTLTISGSPMLTCVSVDTPDEATAKYGLEYPEIVFNTDCSSQIDLPITDEIFLAYLIDELGVDKNNNGKIQESEAAIYAEEEMILPGNAANFTGITYFTKVKSVVASASDEGIVATLDVNNMDNLEKLTIKTGSGVEILNISSCNALTDVTVEASALKVLTTNEDNTAIASMVLTSTLNDTIQTDLSVLTGLETLSLNGFVNETGILDLTTNTALKNITITGTGINQVDIRGCSALETIATNTNETFTCLAVDSVEAIEAILTKGTDNYVVKTDCADEVEVEISDALKAILVGIDSIDTHDDDRITLAEVQAYTGTLTISENAADFSELAVFENITGIDISNVESTEIDLSTFTHLQTVDINNSTIESINASNLESLQDVSIQNATGLTNINLEGSTQLDSLNIGNADALEKLDISTNTALTSLTVSATETAPINSVDLTYNTALTDVNLSFNNVTDIDLSKNSSLTSLVLTVPGIQSLSLKDGVSEEVLTEFVLNDATNLVCVEVDDPEYMQETFGATYPEITFTDDCSDLTTIIIPDPIFKTYLTGELNIGTDAKGDILKSKAEAFIGEMTITNAEIESLEGIQNFTGLTGLTISDANANLTSLNVSKLPNLENIAISNSNITTVTIDECTALTSVTLTNAGTAELSMEGCSVLSALTISGNALTSLDVSKLASLEELTVEEDGITCILVADVENAELKWRATVNQTIGFLLDCIPGEELEIANEAFKNFLLANEDINTNKDKIISKEEAEAFAGKLVISGDSIGVLQGLEAFTSMTALEISDVSTLEGLDLTENKNLESIVISNTGIQILDISGIDNLKSVTIENNSNLENFNINGCTNLETVSFSQTKVSSVNVSENTKLKTLQIPSNQLTSLNLSKNILLETLDVSNNNLTSLDLSKNPNLTLLNTSGNNALNCLAVANPADFENNPDITIIKDDALPLSEECKQVIQKTYEITITDCKPYMFGTTVYAESGTYTETFTDSEDNDSIVTLHLTIADVIETSITVDIFNGESYLFGDENLSESGKYQETFESASGCDSIVTLTLNVKTREVKYNVIRVSVFGEYEFSGQVLTISGNYKDTLKTATGADSIVVLSLEILDTKLISKEDFIHEGETYNFYDDVLTDAGTYKAFFKEGVGNDSIVTLYLSLLEENEKAEVTSITECGSYWFNGKELTESGLYKDTLKSVSGLDSIVALNLIINDIDEVNTHAIIYQGESFEFGGMSLKEEGKYSKTFKNKAGCDSTVYLDLYVIPNTQISTEVSAKVCGEYSINGAKIFSSGRYMESYKTDNGQDSIVIINLEVLPQYTITNKEFIMYGDELAFGNKTLTKSGTYTEYYETTKGCDSTISLDLEVLPLQVYYDYQVMSACGSYDFFGAELTESGTYRDTASKDGIDTIHIVKLSVGNQYNIEKEEFIKPGEKYTFGSDPLSDAGIYTKTFESVSGCDSTVTLRLTKVDENTILERKTVEACGDYEFNGEVLTESGSYKAIYSTQDGNDSIVALDLTIKPIFETTVSKTIKDGEILNFGTQNIVSEGTYTETFTSRNDCDSIVTMTVTVNHDVVKLQEIFYITCGAYNFKGTLLEENGVYYDTLKTKYGTDSIVKINLTINQGVEVDTVAYLLEGEEFVFGNQILTVPGLYTEVFHSSTSCDSVVNLTLFDASSASVVELLEEQACGSYIFYGNEYTQSGTYFHLIESESRENDTLVRLELTMTESFHIVLDEYIYEGESYAFGDDNLTESGSYTNTYTTAEGCDSVVDLTLSVVPEGTILNIIEESACSEFEFRGDILNKGGKYEYKDQNNSGNIVLTVLYLTLHQDYYQQVNANIYKGQVFSYNGIDYTDQGKYVIPNKTEFGCDSTTLVNIKYFTFIDTIHKTVCEEYDFFGQTLTSSGTYTYNKENETGTDSTIVLYLTVASELYTVIDTTIYRGEVFVIGNNKVIKSTSFSTTLKSSMGCDSIVTVHLTVIEGYRNADTVLYREACGYYDYNGEKLSESGNYYYKFTNSQQKDSTVRVSLTILDAFEEEIFVTLKAGSTYEIADTTLKTLGNYIFTFESETGCDSIVTVHITTENNPPVFELDKILVTIPVKENKKDGTEIYTLKATDPDNDPLTFRFENESEVFKIDSLTGMISVKNNDELDYEENRNFVLVAIVSDGLAEDLIVIDIKLKDDVTDKISELEKQVFIYPTSVASMVHIQSDFSEGMVYILTTAGAELFKVALSKNMDIDLSALQKGAYFVKVETESGNISEIIIKE